MHGGKCIYPKNHQKKKKNAFGTLNFGYKGNFITNGHQDQNIPFKTEVNGDKCFLSI